MSDLNKLGANTPDDTKRMNWLCAHVVQVRKPLLYGSHEMFHAQCDSDDCEEYHSTLREQVDEAIRADEKAAVSKRRYCLTRLQDCPPGTRFYFAYSKRPIAATLIWVSVRKGKACWHAGHAFDLLATRKYCSEWTKVWARV